jgi:hypothetical protein
VLVWKKKGWPNIRRQVEELVAKKEKVRRYSRATRVKWCYCKSRVGWEWHGLFSHQPCTQVTSVSLILDHLVKTVVHAGRGQDGPDDYTLLSEKRSLRLQVACDYM